MLIPSFQQQLTQHFPADTPFLVCLSGGVDSVVLLHLLAQTKQPLRAIHVHHGLSPNADAWAVFCQQLCAELKVPLKISRVQVARQNVEANAREARYQAILHHLQPNEVAVTAHHLDDQAETFLLALKRGSGIKGLAGMQAVKKWQNVVFFRPLLAFAKADLLAYAKQHQLRWIEDESNQDTHFDRNFLRQQILPMLNQRWAGFSQQVAKTAQLCAEQQTLLDELLADELAQRADFNKKSLNFHRLLACSIPKQNALLRLWFSRLQLPMPSQQWLESLRENVLLAQADKNPKLPFASGEIHRFQQQIFFVAPQSPVSPCEFKLKPECQLNLTSPEQTDLGNITRANQQLIYKKNAFFHRLSLPDSLKNETLQLQFGLKSKVKQWGKEQHEEMKKLWQQAGVPVWLRDRTPVLCWQDEVVAVLFSPEDEIADESTLSEP